MIHTTHDFLPLIAPKYQTEILKNQPPDLSDSVSHKLLELAYVLDRFNADN